MKQKLSIHLFILFQYAVVSIFISTTACADHLTNVSSSNDWENVSTEHLADIISQTTIQINEHIRKASEVKKTIEFAWNNPDFTSDTIAEKRQTLKQAETAFIKARLDLQKEMSSLPEIQKLSEESKTLLNTIETLQTKNNGLIKLLKQRRKPQPSNN